MKTRLTRTLAVGAAFALGLSLSACGSDSDDGDTTSSGSDLELVSSGKLTVCSELPYKPFEYEENGEFTGFDIDLVRAISEGLDLELVVVPSSFDGLQSGTTLASQTCDVVASAMTITDERKAKLDFADGYYDSEQSLLVPAESDIASIEDLSGRRVAVQAETTGEAFTEENAPEDAEIKSFPGDADMYNAIEADQVDAILQDLPVNLVHTEDGRYQIVEQFDTGEQYGFAVEKDASPNLLAAINEQLAALRDSGTYDELYNKYFAVN